ncbi:MAG: substrate-binding domain-containing protein [Clostridia bacterium]|nr:substrate-binding domain-containing protein [Clostridia bacterium]
MKRRIKKRTLMLMSVLFLLGLGVLFSLVTFDRLGTESEALIELSVIVRDSDSGLWTASRYGMEQAAADYGAELRFLTLTTSNSSDSQQTLLEREVSNGADAIVLVPADPIAIGESVRAASASASIVTMESDMSDYGASACICVDGAELSRAIGASVIEGTLDGDSVIITYSSQANFQSQLRVTETAATLRENGRRVTLCSVERIGMYLNFSPPDAVIALDSAALERVAQLVINREERPKIYGTGATSDIVHYLEIGIIEVIAAKNEYAAGYLAVQTAVQKARHEKTEPIDYLPFYLITYETMYEPDNQKLLFPVS